MSLHNISEDFYEQVKPGLHRRIGRDLRLARRVLDLGCGACDLACYLSDTYRQEITGVDISSDGFPHSRRSRRGMRLRCLRCDATHLDFLAEHAMDAVVTMWALHEMTNVEGILGEVRRVLRSGGELLVVDFPRDSLAQRLWNEDYYTPEEVKALLRGTPFGDVRVREIDQGQMLWARGHKPTIDESGGKIHG